MQQVFQNIDASGLRYVYGLPVYNKEQVDASFSAKPSNEQANIIPIDYESGKIDYKKDETDEYFSKTKIPPYAYAYMLTSILGVDYVDADNIPGPSDGDLGYWVKFNYRKVADDFQWRAPFTGAKYNPGYLNTPQDNRASYTYGKKEVWYLATAETASHKAEFHISPRKDAHGAHSELQNPNDNNILGEKSYQLDKIELYSKLDPSVSIQTVYLDYNKRMNEQGEEEVFTLCKGVENSSETDASSGKLTLTKLHFEYRGNKMGAQTPYRFIYGDGTEASNPDYAPHNVDRWGNYRNLKEVDGLGAASIAELWQHQLDFPYVHQELDRSKHDEYARAWELSEIQLPSGGKIKVEYEADDYAYVQNKQAMYMTDIVAVFKCGNSTWYGS